MLAQLRADAQYVWNDSNRLRSRRAPYSSTHMRGQPVLGRRSGALNHKYHSVATVENLLEAWAPHPPVCPRLGCAPQSTAGNSTPGARCLRRRRPGPAQGPPSPRPQPAIRDGLTSPCPAHQGRRASCRAAAHKGLGRAQSTRTHSHAAWRAQTQSGCLFAIRALSHLSSAHSLTRIPGERPRYGSFKTGIAHSRVQGTVPQSTSV